MAQVQFSPTNFAAEMADACPASPANPLIGLESFHKDRFDFCEAHSHESGDLALVAALVELMGVRAEFSLTAALSARFGASEAEVGSAVRLVLRCLRLLHLCGYCKADIELMVVHASSYLKNLMSGFEQKSQPSMSLQEIAHIFCLLMYLAHSYIEDQNCPLSVWHQHLFRRYCDLKTLSQAVMRVLEQLAFALRIEPSELQKRLEFIQESCTD
eukprot:gnl/MRDRNA2_/MRDRNA2_169217_c0_seq1.p1 gnl/MRDRNA2_/MRDRNA2_169217_c0~~gnl/MRDRNA2_/MRDRNA2_169217_c0_seq1.p1  ORF type:complete len:214 (+),score=43.52 gnl/MRDRNA2_/MRDRNA2_169217_c0_seq1:131-772(+)